MRIIASAIMIPSLVPNELSATRLVSDEIFTTKVIGIVGTRNNGCEVTPFRDARCVGRHKFRRKSFSAKKLRLRLMGH